MNEHKHFFVCVFVSPVSFVCLSVCSLVLSFVRSFVRLFAAADGGATGWRVVAGQTRAATEMLHFKLKCECKRKLQKKH